jgi:hypothetical protein
MTTIVTKQDFTKFRYFRIIEFKTAYLPKRVHFEKFRGFVGNPHLEILHEFDLHTTVLCSNKSFVGILVASTSMKDLNFKRISVLFFMLLLDLGFQLNFKLER